MTHSQLKTVSEGPALRIDPEHFPQKFSYVAKGADVRIGVRLDIRGAVIRRTLPSSNLPFSIALPGRAFKGVAARAVVHSDGSITVTLELHHADPEMCIPLLVADNLSDIVADWQEWASMYDIPMLMVEGDGVARPVDAKLQDCFAANDSSLPRHQTVTRRHPRLTVRFKGGSLGVSLKVKGRTIAI